MENNETPLHQSTRSATPKSYAEKRFTKTLEPRIIDQTKTPHIGMKKAPIKQSVALNVSMPGC